MPFGESWARYLTFLTSSLLAMFAGSEVVHRCYNPLKDFEEYIENERKKQKI